MSGDPAAVRARVVVVGDSSVGKTSLLAVLMGDGFNAFEQNTVGANWHLRVQEAGGRRVELQIWDTAGQERYRSLGPLYYRTAAAAVVVFDVSSRASFASVGPWADAVTAVAGAETVVVVVGNKADLADAREVQFQDGAEWARERGFDFAETSAKTAEGVQQLFDLVAERVAARACARTAESALGDAGPRQCC
jgi:small GTP-binding protein